MVTVEGSLCQKIQIVRNEFFLEYFTVLTHIDQIEINIIEKEINLILLIGLAAITGIDKVWATSDSSSVD